MNATVLSNTSLATYLIDGSLYSGNSEINDVGEPLKKNFFITVADIKITIIARKYSDAAIKPFEKVLVFLPTISPAKSTIIGNFAEQGIKGVHIIVILLSSSSSTVLAVIIPGTLQPDPTIKGIKDLPLKPNFLNTLSNKKAILDIYPLVSKIDMHKNKMIN